MSRANRGSASSIRIRNPSYSLRAAAKTERATPTAQQVEQCDLLGDADRVVPWDHGDGGAKVDAFNSACVIGQQLQWRRRHGKAGEVMFQREQRVEAERLSEIAQLGMLVDNRNVRTCSLGQHVERHTDFHGGFPPSDGQR
jgi:hypothetical protein